MNGLPTISVDITPLDRLAEKHGFPQFLKIDVEGFEKQVLQGAGEILRRRPKIGIEVHVEWIQRYHSSVGEVLNLLHLEDYDVWVLGCPAVQVNHWEGEGLEALPPPKFHLYLKPKQ